MAPEIENARSKLEEALQFIIEKADESPSTSEDEYKEGNEISIKKEHSPVPSPVKKPTQRAQRKRRRRDETLNKNANSYVMKLFDRAVDLTPFNEQTPLYPICRAWINNQELYKSSYQVKDENDAEDTAENTNKDSEETDSDEVHQLPAPVPLDGRVLRIPSPVPQPGVEFTVCSDEQNPLSKDSLMANHLQHWKAVRQKWKQAAKTNEERYHESAAILKSIFERAQQEESEMSDQQRWDS
ncbi:hypothetical protein JTE90_028262 [Oedothorax gibbosus]|uniref:Protein lin-37 homolog n=1 Tax=Oedothorax gibbosus TaxID=931172 RepID=A0AAV6UDC1_9ARAC|nr:hypothetical protein JTE90_028262 [Oedothorax gibbosus]